MRKLISGMFITLDGVVEAPHAWNPPYYNEEMTDVVQALLAASDTHLYGRRSTRCSSRSSRAGGRADRARPDHEPDPKSLSPARSQPPTGVRRH